MLMGGRRWGWGSSLLPLPPAADLVPLKLLLYPLFSLCVPSFTASLQPQEPPGQG